MCRFGLISLLFFVEKKKYGIKLEDKVNIQ